MHFSMFLPIVYDMAQRSSIRHKLFPFKIFSSRTTRPMLTHLVGHFLGELGFRMVEIDGLAPLESFY